MGYNLLINGVYWGYNPLILLTSWDIQAGKLCYFKTELFYPRRSLTARPLKKQCLEDNSPLVKVAFQGLC